MTDAERPMRVARAARSAHVAGAVGRLARGVARGRADDVGAASLAVVGVLVGVVVLASALVATGHVLAARSRVAGAADAAALAAADVVAGLVPGAPCDRAAALATANRVRLAGCVVAGTTVTVAVADTVGGLAVTGLATAGPPPAGTAPPVLSP